MIVMDMFIYIVLRGLWMGGEIITSFTFAPFSMPIFPQSQDELSAALFQAQNTFCNRDSPINIIDRWLELGDPTRLQLQEISLYGKYAGGQTQVRKEAVNFLGTRVVGSQALPPQTTIRTYASSQVYGEKGSTIGLPGVYEADAGDGLISPTSDAVTRAEVFCNTLDIGFDVAATNDYEFRPCTVKRIRYNTPSGKVASRMPLEPGDVPSCYKLGERAVQLVSGTNNHRKIGTGS